MAIKLVHKGTTTEYSKGDNLDPVNTGLATLDNNTAPPDVDTSPAIEVELLAQGAEYREVSILTAKSDDFTFLFSLNNTIFQEVLEDLTLDATEQDVRQSLWVKSRVSNSDILSSGIKLDNKIKINYTKY